MKISKSKFKSIDFGQYKIIAEEDGEGVALFKCEKYLQIGIYNTRDEGRFFQFDFDNADHMEALRTLYQVLGEL